MTPADWHTLIAASGLPRTDARALAEQASGRPRSWLIAHGDEPAAPDAAAAFATLAARRRSGEPLAYLLGWREFLGRRFSVGPAVLVPRPETEGLVEVALARLAGVVAPRVLDLGTGSGVIAVSIALERPDARVLATDLSDAALAIARANAAALGAGERVAFASGDWWAALPADAGPFEAIVANPPYVAALDPHLGSPALAHEPLAALASGPDGLAAIETIAAGAPAHLAPGGCLIIEHGRDQGGAVRARFARAGLEAVATLPDLHGLDRVSVGRYGTAGPAARRVSTAC
jgi:release factor glutamine methyltransferase